MKCKFQDLLSKQRRLDLNRLVQPFKTNSQIERGGVQLRTAMKKGEYRQTPNAGTRAFRSRLMKFTGALVNSKTAVKLSLIE